MTKATGVTGNYVGYGDYFPISSGTYTNTQIRQNSRIQIASYPNDCDLHISERRQEMHNIGALEQDFKS